MKAYLLSTQEGDWEGLYINGGLIQEDHNLGEAEGPQFWLEVAHLYGLKAKDLVIAELEDADNDNVSAMGGLPFKLTDLIGSYT